jgi:hypothetical protein
MFDSNLFYDAGKERQRDLIASAEARRQIKRLEQAQNPARRTLPGQLLRLLVTMVR